MPSYPDTDIGTTGEAPACPAINPNSRTLIARPVPHAPGRMRDQFVIADLAARDPWLYQDWRRAYAAARRTVLHHARRQPA